MALAGISRLVQAGLRVPDDISVLGYDDDDFAPYASPPLTTIRIPTARVATRAAARLTSVFAVHCRTKNRCGDGVDEVAGTVVDQQRWVFWLGQVAKVVAQEAEVECLVTVVVVGRVVAAVVFARWLAIDGERDSAAGRQVRS